MMHFDEKSMWGFKLERDPTYKGAYMAGMGVCEDPSCPCAVVTIGCKELDPPPGASQLIPYVFSLDLKARKLMKTPANEGRPGSTEFGRSYLRELGDEEWVHLRELFLSAKRRLTETLNPEKVKYRFPVREIEDERLMVSYISVLPFEDKLDFTCDSREHFVNDHYCLNSDCACDNVHLAFHEKPAHMRPSAPIVGSLWYCYDSKTHNFDENSMGSRESVETLFRSLKTARPDLSAVLRKRHRTLRLLYGESLRQNSARSSPSKVGRNDPCPCGSGRKYKHCCGR